MIVTLRQAKKAWSRLVAAALAGEEVIIASGGTPLVRLDPVKPRGKRAPGRLKGLFTVDDAAFEPLSEEELAIWEDGPVYPDGD